MNVERAHTHQTGIWHRVMRARDPNDEHRAATPLELFFDLCFVVAVAQAAVQLHHALAEGHLGTALAGYLAVFFAIWWAWMNFTWFASAYDTDDVAYRLMTMLQMGGALVLAAGVPAAFEHYDFTIVTIGYVIMRVAMIGQWLRAAAEHPASRAASLRYAAGIGVVQALWIVRLWTPEGWTWITFLLLVFAELAVPAWAEARGRATSWHPEHIAERYGLFTIIVLGEVVLATLLAVQSGLSEHGISAQLILVAVGALVLVFALWWIYFSGAAPRLANLRVALIWGYGHYVVFAAVAAVGAGIGVVVDSEVHQAHVSSQAAALAVAVPVAVFLVVLAPLHRLTGAGTVARNWLVVVGAVAVLAVTLTVPIVGLGGATLGVGLVAAATLAGNLVVGDGRRT